MMLDPLASWRLWPASQGLTPVRTNRGQTSKSKLLGSAGPAWSEVIFVIKFSGIQHQKCPHQYRLQHLQQEIIQLVYNHNIAFTFLTVAADFISLNVRVQAMPSVF